MKKSVILLAITLALAAWVYFFEVRPGTKVRSTDEAKTFSKTLTGAAKEEITGLKLAKAGGQAVTLEPSGDQWVITAPVQAPAEEATVRQILWDVEWAEKELTIPAAEVTPEKLKSYGLDAPRGTIEVTAAGKGYRFIVGGPNPDDTFVYVREGDAGPVHLVKKSIATAVDVSLYDIRNKQVVPLSTGEIGYVRLFGRGKAVLEKKEAGHWNLTDPFADHADPDAVKALLEAAGKLKVLSFVSDDPADFAKYGLDNPASYVAIAQTAAAGKSVTINLGVDAPAAQGSPRQVYAAVANSRSVVTLDADTVDKLFPTVSDLQAKTLARYDTYTLKTMTITSGLSQIEISRADLNWRITKPFDAEAGSGAVIALLDTLRAARVEEFVTVPRDKAASAEYGMDAPRASFSYVEEGASPVGVVFGKEAGPGLVYARRTDTPGIYKTSDKILASLSTPALAVRSLDMQKIEPAQISSLSIERAGETVTFENPQGSSNPGAWRLSAPIAAPVNAGMLAGILVGLQNTRAEEFVEENPADPARYGLDKPEARVTCAMSAGAPSPRALLLGGRLSDGKRYARLDGDTIVFTVNPSFARALFDEPRDPSVFNFNTQAAAGVEFNKGDAKSAASKASGEWLIDAPEGARAAQGAIAAEVTHLAGLQTAKFASYATSDLAKYGLDRPQAVVRVTLPSGVAALSVGNMAPSGHYYATSTTVEGVFLLTPADVKFLLAPDALFQSPASAAPPAPPAPVSGASTTSAVEQP